jgi:ABC-2 type transport system permease protein
LWLVGPFVVDAEAEAMLKSMPLLAVPTDAEMGDRLRVDGWAFGSALWNVAAFLFAVSGLTMWLSARGRFRWKVVGIAIGLFLLLFLANLVGQLWEAAAWLRPFSPFFYFQPQQIVLHDRWTVDLTAAWGSYAPVATVNVLTVLFTMGAVGYLAAWRTFVTRDLPAPL